MQNISKIPYVDFHDDPVDVNIRIHGNSPNYEMTISAHGQESARFILKISIGDLSYFNKEFQIALTSIAKTNDDVEQLTKDQLSERIRPLAEIGNLAFKKVFQNSDANSIMRGLDTDYPLPLSIHITAEEFSLPWELLYDNSVENPLSYQHFWGFRHIISRVIPLSCRSNFVTPEINISTCPKLGLLTCKDLPSVVKKEIPYFEKLENDGKISLVILRDLEPNKWKLELEEFNIFWTNDFHLAHLACHACYDNSTAINSHILLSSDFKIQLKDLELYNFKINGLPLIVMNACETGNLNPLYSFNFAQAFLQHGARAVVATECSIPDSFAADFGIKLYSFLLEGNYLGISLLETRKHFIERYNNPTGLVYSIYGPPSIRLKR